MIGAEGSASIHNRNLPESSPMSQLLVSQYQREIADLMQFGGSSDESSIRKAFSNLLDNYSRPQGLRLVDEIEYVTRTGAKVYPDGTLKDALRLTHGYWEAKDEADDLDQEIAKKRAKGYPTDNILFEDSRHAVLIQNDREVMRAAMSDAAALDRLITSFVSYERLEIRDFRRAIEHFKTDLPAVIESLRAMVEQQQQANKAFALALKRFLKLCRDSINADISADDVREMLLQHILTEDIFLRIFDDAQFHRENNIARELTRIEETFFTGTTKKNTLKGLETYYGAIRQAAAGIADHHEKQRFLKAIYENFYKVYNPKLADRLGVVYTPGEIVRFMLQGAEHLLHKHFDRLFQDKHVEILDPAVGTGTFVCDLIEHLKGNKAALRHKYQNEIHCNEVAILPYYIANLNIEFTYAQLAGEYLEFPHICFVDTLDNLGFEKTHIHQQMGLDFGLTAENTARIHKQNKRRISVILGNPPYNANQMNENDNNKNRLYAGIDARIKETWIAASQAQKTKMYDMYARFFRWAADRIDADGIIAYITNRSFIDSRTFDGFRLEMAREFDEAWIVDLGGDVRANPKLSGTTHNVFGIQTGVAISFWIKRKKADKRTKHTCRIYYARRPEQESAADKLAWLASTPFPQVEFEHLVPDAKGNWINQADNDFEDLLPLCSKETKAAKTPNKERALFKLYSLGISTNRDEWLYDDNYETLTAKAAFLTERYTKQKNNAEFDLRIKWSEALKLRHSQNVIESFDKNRLRSAIYRPFSKRYFYDSPLFTDRPGSKASIFPLDSNAEQQNELITICAHPQLPFSVHSVGALPDAGYASRATQTFPRWTYSAGNRVDNITDWGVRQFEKRYGKQAGVNRESIFHYVYAVLHNPAYREKYALNLKRELPRIPFYDDFAQWVTWGQELLALHIGFETVEPAPLQRIDLPGIAAPKAKLKADPATGRILIDEATTLANIPPTAWRYRLGNRSALEWVLDQYKESTPRDPTIREKFNTYRFADYKEKVIDLLGRVCTVSVDTQGIIEKMNAYPPQGETAHEHNG